MSTYSSNLRLELITTGTQAGTWGTTTNTNLGTLVESAISGYTTVVVTSTAQALTANNGAADESRNAILKLTTSGVAAAFAVYAPPSPKEYTIYNASSYTATIYNSTVLGNTTAAGQGVAVPAGTVMTIWSDGVSFSQQNTYLFSPSIGGIPTAPTASTGTSTTQIATTAFVAATLLASVYPVGSIYSSTVATNPGTLLGFGTWVAYGAGRVLIGNGGGYTAGATGGSADAIVVAHTHTGATLGQSVGHTHGFSGTTDSAGLHNHVIDAVNPGLYGPYNKVSGQNDRADGADYGTSNEGVHTHTFSGNTGGTSSDHAHEFTTNSSGASGTGANLQPYVVVYMWNRTA